jgi:glucose/arabinose dehydrogenase
MPFAHARTRIARLFLRPFVFFFALPLVAPATAQQQMRRVESSAGPVQVETLAQGLQNPWGLAFLPDGRMLVSERPGRLRVVTRAGAVSAPLAGVPAVHARGQGGLLHVALSPSFARDREIFFAFAEPGAGGSGTALARARLNADASAIEDVAVIFRQEPKVEGGLHYGARIAFDRAGLIYLTLGERGLMTPAQDLSTHMGAVVRIARDGAIPKDNPFVGRPGAQPEIWSHGHRNVQGAAVHPRSGALWTHEMGPRGGDEVNIARAGANHGWPLVSWGDHYDGRDIPDPPTRPEFTDAIHVWRPSIAPSGMAFYEADLFPKWRGSLLVGALVGQSVIRLSLEGERVTGEERIRLGARIRDVTVGPDGAIYAVTDEANGKILRLSPAGSSAPFR